MAIQVARRNYVRGQSRAVKYSRGKYAESAGQRLLRMICSGVREHTVKVDINKT